MPNLPRHALYKATEYLIQWIENKNSSNRFSDDRKCQIIKQIDLDLKNNIEFVLALYDISIIRTTRKKSTCLIPTISPAKLQANQYKTNHKIYYPFNLLSAIQERPPTRNNSAQGHSPKNDFLRMFIRSFMRDGRRYVTVMLKRRPCRLQTVQTLQTECYFFLLVL